MSDIIFNEKNEVIDLKNKNKADYKSLAKNNQLSEKFISENMQNMDWEIITIHQKISIKTALYFHNYIKWSKIKDNPNVTPDVMADLLLLAKHKGNINVLVRKEADFESFVRRNKDALPWNYVDLKHFSNDFIAEISNSIPWGKVFANDRKDEAFIRSNLHKIAELPNTWYQLSRFQTVSEQFFRDFQENVYFHFIVGMKDVHTLSDAFVEEFKYVLVKEHIIKNQKNNLSAAYLKEYRKFNVDNFYRNTTEEWLRSQPKYRLNWYCVAEFSKFSDDFLLENLERLHIWRLANNHKFSEELVRKIAPKINSKEELSYVFVFQDFSEDFLEEFIDKIDLEIIGRNELFVSKLSDNFLKKYKKKLKL